MAKFDPFLSLDCARVEGVGAQSKERKGSNFAAQRSRAIVRFVKGCWALVGAFFDELDSCMCRVCLESSVSK